MVIPSSEHPARLSVENSVRMIYLSANLPAAYFGVPSAQVVEVGLEVEI
jgi:KUP system potassium uptake protein